jgi:MSHA biogenesis protein MshQ
MHGLAFAKANQTITFASQPNRSDAARPFTVSATASSGLTVTFTSLTTSICTVSGTTVSVVADGTCTIAANQAGNLNYNAAGQVTQSFSIVPFCSPPPNIPSSVSVTCTCDTFNRASINPSPMFGGTNWAVSASDTTGVVPYINSTTRLLRLTENTGDNAKAATAPGIYPAAGNYISVEFNHYAYNGSGADGVGVTLSDSSIPAVPGGYGGSQGYAPEGTPGFAGGWLGTALDEYGNYSNPTEGRNGGTGFTPEEVGMRGPGSGTNGYNWITGTASDPGGLSIDNHTSTTPSPGYMYQVIVDARNEASGAVNVSVNRDSTTFDGNNYAQLIAPYNVYSTAQTAQSSGWITQIVPNYWQISFTSSTGGSTNIHEIGDMRICAQTVYPPSGSQASGFSAIDSAYPAASGSTVPAYQNFQTGDIYMKLQGTAFKLWVAALTSHGISTGYSAATAKYVLLNLVQNTGGTACGPDSARTCTSSCYNQAAVTGGSQILTFATSNTTGALLTSNITLNTAYSDLVAVMRECTTSACTAFTTTAAACSADSFSVRPTGVSTVVSNATNATASGTPVFTAGSGAFTVTATTAGVSGQPSGYNGTLRINNSAVQALIDSASEASPWTPTIGTIAASPANQNITFPAATSGTGSATSVGSFTYSEVGSFLLPGYSPTTSTYNTAVRGVYDGVTSATDCASLSTAQCDALRLTTWSGVDSVSTKNDCDIDSYSNTIDANGKYGCNFGNIANTATIGRFSPDHYAVASSPAPVITPRSDISSACEANLAASDSTFVPFSYMGEPFNISFTLDAMNASGAITQNYQGNYVKFNSMNTVAPWTSTAAGSTGTMNLAMAAVNATQPGYTNSSKLCSVYFSSIGVTSYSCPGATVLPVSNGGTPRVAALTTPAVPAMLWSSGTGNGGVGSFSANVTLQRLTGTGGPDGPFNTLGVGILPTDTDGVTATIASLNLATNNSATAPTADRVSLGNTAVKFGMLKLQNNFGSAAANLPITGQMMYWNGGGFAVNSKSTGVVPNYSYDSCTTISGSNVNMAYSGSLVACNTYMPNSTTASNGTMTFNLAAPGQSGSVTLTDLISTSSSNGTACSGSTTKTTATPINASFLQGNWNYTGNYNVNPSAVATFGVYSGVPQVIYIRESY